MEQEEIDFAEVEALGFKKTLMDDNVHRKQYGYDDFYVKLKICKKFYAEWDNKTRTLEVYQIDNKHDGNIISGMKITDLDHWKQMLKFLNPSKFKNL